MEFHKIWIEQCEAARGIREHFGHRNAIEYLIGEKFLNFLHAAETHEEFRGEVSEFTAEIKKIFARRDIEEYFEELRKAPENLKTAEDPLRNDDGSSFPLEAMSEAERILRREIRKFLEDFDKASNDAMSADDSFRDEEENLFPGDAVSEAERILRIEQARDLLLGDR